MPPPRPRLGRRPKGLADYRRTAARQGWRDIRPTCKISYQAGTPAYGIAFPQPADFG